LSNTKPSTRAAAKRKVTAARAESVQRHGQALELRKANVSYDAIAKRLGYSSRASAYRAVQAELKRVVTEPAEELLELEIARLEALRKAHWMTAIGGDVAATKIQLQIGDQLAKLRGLYDYERRMAEVAERKQALDEAQAALVAGAILAIIDRLNLTPAQQEIAAIAAPEEMRRISGQVAA
jgi:hypothetical protein